MANCHWIRKLRVKSGLHSLSNYFGQIWKDEDCTTRADRMTFRQGNKADAADDEDDDDVGRVPIEMVCGWWH